MFDEGYFRVGDVVRLRDMSEPRFVVTGFGAVYNGRLSGYVMEPGIYLDPTHVAVRTLDGLQRPQMYFHTVLAHVDDAVAESRQPRDRHPSHIRVRDLPDTAFWEGDLVRGRVGGLPLFVHTINYELLVMGSAAPEPQHRPFYVGPALVPGRLYHTLFEEDATGESRTSSELVLVERGNAWKHHHGEPTSFAGLVDEILFHLMMGWFIPYEEVVGTASQARRLVRENKADGYFLTGDSQVTERTLAVSLTQATAELRAAFRHLSVDAPLSAPQFRLP